MLAVALESGPGRDSDQEEHDNAAAEPLTHQSIKIQISNLAYTVMLVLCPAPSMEKVSCCVERAGY